MTEALTLHLEESKKENWLSSIKIPVERISKRFRDIAGSVIKSTLPYAVGIASAAVLIVLPIEVVYKIAEPAMNFNETISPFVAPLHYGGEALAAAIVFCLSLKKARDTLFC